MRRSLIVLTLATAGLVLAASIAPVALARGDQAAGNPVLRTLRKIAVRVQRGFASAEKHFEIGEEFQTRSLQNQSDLLAGQKQTAESLEQLLNIVFLNGPDLTVLSASPFGQDTCFFDDGSLVLLVNNSKAEAGPSELAVLAPDVGFSKRYAVPPLSAQAPFPSNGPGNFLVFIPDPPFCTSQNCNFLAFADFGDSVAESNEANNLLNFLDFSCVIVGN